MKNKLKNEALLESKRKRLKSTLKLWEKGFETTEKLDEIKAEVKGLEIDLDQDKDLQKELADLKMTEKKIIESACPDRPCRSSKRKGERKNCVSNSPRVPARSRTPMRT